MDTAPNTTTAAPAAAEPAEQPISREAQTMFAWIDADVQAGRFSAEEGAKMKAEAIGGSVPAPTAADPIAEHLTAEGFAPAQAKDFHLPPMLKDGESFTPELQQADATMRGWLEGAMFTREIGSSLAAEVEKVARTQMNADDATREIYARGQRAALERVWGPEKTAERIALAQKLVRELDAKQPGLIRFMNDTGAGNCAFVIAQIALHAERLAGRK
jgi:hypothetical protein